MTQTRRNELESLLARLRAMCFINDKAAALIPVLKARLMPVWHADRPARRDPWLDSWA